ncbi:MAG: mechanosensitive ion channel family protein [Elusimicrobiota bacterium]
MGTIRLIEDTALSYFRISFFGIFLYQYLMALLFIFAGFLLRRMSDRVLDRLRKAARKTAFRYDDILIDVLRKPLPLAFVVIGLYLAVHSLPVPTEPVNIRHFLHAAFRSLSVLFVVWVAVRLIDGICAEWTELAKKTPSGLDDQLVPIIRKSGKVFLILIGGILVLQNMGYSVGGLLAGFGLGGAAVALAAKDSLSNLFGSIVVFIDRPFSVGDWIEMDGCEGTVEEIGLRTTRVRTFANSLMTVPNSKFTTSVINNWQRMKKRRIKFTIGLTYGTTAEQMEKIIERIRRLIRDDENIRDDFFLVNFDAFGPSSFDVFIYCFTKSTRWADFLEAKQKFMLNIVREVHEMGLDFAFPTRTLHVAGPVAVEGGEAAERPR